MTFKIDEKDLKIISILKEHGDYTTRQIAKKTSMPITTVHHRIKRLKQEKVIKRFTIDIDYNSLDQGFLAYILISVNLPLLKEKKKSQNSIANEIKKFYFVERADIVSGGTDLVALIRVKDVKEFDHVLFNKIQQIEGIEKTQSLIVIYQAE